MYRDPKLIVKLEARCHSYEDALKLQSMLSDFVSCNELAGEHIDECEIFYVMPLEMDGPTNEEIAERLYEEIENIESTA